MDNFFLQPKVTVRLKLEVSYQHVTIMQIVFFGLDLEILGF